MSFNLYGKTIEIKDFLVYIWLYYTISPILFSLETKNIFINILWIIICLIYFKKSRNYLLRKFAILILMVSYYKSKLYSFTWKYD